MKRLKRLGGFFCLAGVVGLGQARVSYAQEPAKEPTASEMLAALQSMQEKIGALEVRLARVENENAQFRSESEGLHKELAALQASRVQSRTSEDARGGTPAAAPDGSSDQPTLEEQVRLLNARVDDQYQTKVESGSKYRVKLSGMILTNLFGNHGTVDNLDLPGVVEPNVPTQGGGALAGTLRQSQIRLQVFGPTVAGARTSGDLEFDFAGGFPDTSAGVALGLMRLRTGTVRFDWENTSIIAGQDLPFFSPLSPTSLATVAEPAFSYSGNLWTWIPQIRVEHNLRLQGSSSLLLQAGILDSFTGEPPLAQAERKPQAGESSGMPAYAARVAFRKGESDRPLAIGLGTYWGRQNWGFDRMVDGWGITTDWSIPLGSRLGLIGEFYRGRALGGLGAATYHSVLSTDVLTRSDTRVEGLDVVGGWTQLKVIASPKLEFNVAVGQDNPFSKQIAEFRAFPNLLSSDLGKNRSAMVNFIFHPRSNLLFSTEYRHLDSWHLNQFRLGADHVNMAIGVLF